MKVSCLKHRYKFIPLLIIFLLLNNTTIYSQNQNALIGKWLDYDLECPDILVFEHNGVYSILNECYEDNSGEPYEKGYWVYNTRLKKVILKKRVFSTNIYYLNNKNSEVVIDDISINKKLLLGKYRKYKVKWVKKPSVKVIPTSSS